MFIPELFNIISEFLPAKSIISILLLNRENKQNINNLSKFNIDKILFEKKNHFSINYTKFNKNDELFSSNKFHLHLIKTSNTQIIEHLIKNKLYRQYYFEYLFFACDNGHTNIVKLLMNIEYLDINANNNKALRMAIEHNHTDIVKLLMNIEYLDINANNNEALRMAIEHNHTDIVKLLMKSNKLDFTAYKNSPYYRSDYCMFISAYEKANLEILKLLLTNKQLYWFEVCVYVIRIIVNKNYFELLSFLIQHNRISESNLKYLIECALNDAELLSFLMQHNKIPKSAFECLIKRALKNIKKNKKILCILLQDKNIVASINIENIFTSIDVNKLIKTAYMNECDCVFEILAKNKKVNFHTNDNFVFNTGNTNIIKMVLEHASVNFEECLPRSYFFALYKNDHELIDVIMEKKNFYSTELFNTFFEYAAIRNNAYALKLLLKNKLADPCVNENNALLYSCKEKYYDIITLLLHDERVINSDCSNIIGYIIANNNIELVKFLLQIENIDFIKNNNLAINIACKHNNTEIIKILLSCDKINLTVDNNYPLIHAINNNNIEIVKILICDKKINPNKIDTIELILYKHKHVELLEILLQYKKLNRPMNNYVLKVASFCGYFEIVKLLVQDNKIDPSVDNNYAIQQASENGHTNIVKLLLQDKRVNPSANNSYAVKSASDNGHTNIVKLLLQDKRVDPSTYNNFAIRYASEKGHVEVVKLLLQDKRVDPSTYNNFAIKYASEKGHVEVVKLLLQDKRVDPNINIYYNNKTIEIIKLLIKDKRAKFDIDILLDNAIKNNDIDLLIVLIQEKHIDHSKYDNYTIKYALSCINTN